MKHVAKLTKDYELIFQKSAKYMNVSIEKVLEETLVDYIKIIRQKEKALN